MRTKVPRGCFAFIHSCKNYLLSPSLLAAGDSDGDININKPQLLPLGPSTGWWRRYERMTEILRAQCEKRWKDRGEKVRKEFTMPVGSRKGFLGGEWCWGACLAQKGTEGSHVQISGAKAQSTWHAGREFGPSVWFGGLVGTRGAGGERRLRDCEGLILQ